MVKIDKLKKITKNTKCSIFYYLACFLLTSYAFATTNVTISSETNAINANPAATNVETGSGQLQKYIEKRLGIRDDHGINTQGALVADTNNLFSGGTPRADRWTQNYLFIFNVTADTEKLLGWKGGLFGIEFLQFNGQSTNKEAGTIQGYNSLPGPEPLNRTQLYQLWFRQVLFDDKFNFRIGKSVPTDEFGNVIKPVSLSKSNLSLPAVTSLIYTPIFVNTSMLGVMPGYYNSAYGLVFSLTPINNWYARYGVYDGNLAQGKQLGLTGPIFNGSYFHVVETGVSWLLGQESKPGDLAIGAWRQVGNLKASGLSECDASGYYLFGTQRLWYRAPSINNSGISAFYQFGTNSSHVLEMTKFIGAGLTASGLIANRLGDSIGLGAAYSRLNQYRFLRRSEFMLQTYYQAQLLNFIYAEPVLSYIPNPGASPRAHPHLNAAWAASLRLIVLF